MKPSLVQRNKAPHMTESRIKADLNAAYEMIDVGVVDDENLFTLDNLKSQAENVETKIRTRMQKREATLIASGGKHRLTASATREQRKDEKLVEWFREHRIKINAKKCQITARMSEKPLIPFALLCPSITSLDCRSLPEKPNTNAFDKKTYLVNCFKDSDMCDILVCVEKLQIQLQESHDAEERLIKKILTRQTKLQTRKPTKNERKFYSGVRRFEYNMKMKDMCERFYAQWFKDHSLRIEEKIASITDNVY
jgi:hypothetical protein